MFEPTALPKPVPPLRRMNALKAAWKPVLLNWLLPGLGYWRIGEKIRAKVLFSVFGVFITFAFLQLTFGSPEGIHGGVYVPQFEPFQWMPTLGAVATAGTGPIYGVFAAIFGYSHDVTYVEPIRNLTQEYGATYLMVMGLLNWLVSFDIFDRVTGRWVFRLPKDELNQLFEKDKPESE